MREFEKIIGYDSVKQELAQVADVLKNREIYDGLGVKPPRGLFLYGSPGVGKTLMARSVIEASGRPYFICRKDEPNGDFIKVIKRVFEKAKAAAPSIIFLDDMDKFANVDEKHSDAEEYVAVQAGIDELDDADVFVIATANNTRNLPSSLLRAGRFDHKIRVSNPGKRDIEKIISHYMRDKGFAVDLDTAAIASILLGNSSAELESVLNEAGIFAGYERTNIITQDHILKACLHIIRQVPRDAFADKSPVALDDPADTMAKIVFHEAGHALISEVLLPNSVVLMYAYPDGGCTSRHPNESLLSPEALAQNHILISLGGAAATDHIFGSSQVGSSADFARAMEELADLLESESIRGFGVGNPSWKLSSSEAEETLSGLVAVEMNRYYQRAKSIIAANHDLLIAIAKELSEKRILTSADIQAIVSKHPIVHVDTPLC